MTSRAGLVARLAPRASWNIADQVLSSLATFAVTIIAARALSAEDFGHFAVALTLYLFLLGVSQALANQVYLMRFPAEADATALQAARAAGGLALVFGVACAVVVAPVAWFVAGPSGLAVATIAAMFPLLFVQEAWRAVLVARGRPRSATGNDALRAGLQIGALVAVVGAGLATPTTLILAWGLAGWVAAAFGVRQVGGLPSVRAGIAFLRRHADISKFLVAEWLMVLGAAQLGLLAVAWLGSPADVGALRGAQTLLGPINVLGLGAFAFLLTELVRRPGLSLPTRRRVAAGVGLTMALVTLGWAAVLLLLPQAAGTALLGDTWFGTVLILLPMAIYVAGASANTGTLAILRSVGDARSTFVVNSILGPVLLLAVIGGELLGGVTGAAWGFAVATTLTLPLWWLRMEHVLRRRGVARANADPAPGPNEWVDP